MKKLYRTRQPQEKAQESGESGKVENMIRWTKVSKGSRISRETRHALKPQEQK